MNIPPTAINAGHILGVAPLLAYVGYESYQGNTLPTWVGVLLLVLAIVVAVYHGYKLYSRMKKHEPNSLENRMLPIIPEDDE